MCFVRARRNDQMVLTTYGRSSGFWVDPIEKKPLNHFFPGTPVLSFGIAGCKLTCLFCQNWDISKSRESPASVSVFRCEPPGAVVEGGGRGSGVPKRGGGPLPKPGDRTELG